MMKLQITRYFPFEKTNDNARANRKTGKNYDKIKIGKGVPRTKYNACLPKGYIVEFYSKSKNGYNPE